MDIRQTILQELDMTMKDWKNNFFSHNKKLKAVLSKTKRKLTKNVWVARLMLIACVLLLIFFVGLVASRFLANTRAGHYLSLAKDFAFADIKNLDSINGKVNFIILGKGGQGHEAPDLTDTIIFASVDLVNPKATLVSLPRDIWIPELRAKLNSAYYWGNKKQQNGGIALAKSSVESIVGQPVQYAVVVDFSGFEKIINAIDGINIYVETSFVDEKYPLAGKEADMCDGDREFKCRYETLEFKQGWQKMDGETALKYSRSRQAQGDEGTDLARAQRQQNVLASLKNKILSKEVLFSVKKLTALYEATMSVVETDLDDKNMMVLARVIVKAKSSLNMQVLPEKYLTNPPISAKYDFQYVFVPKSGDWKEFQAWVADLVN